jgi:hypothetical protein
MIFQVGDVMTSVFKGDFIIKELIGWDSYLIKFKSGSQETVGRSFLMISLVRNEINFKSYSNNIKPKHWVESKFYF